MRRHFVVGDGVAQRLLDARIFANHGFELAAIDRDPAPPVPLRVVECRVDVAHHFLDGVARIGVHGETE